MDVLSPSGRRLVVVRDAAAGRRTNIEWMKGCFMSILLNQAITTAVATVTYAGGTTLRVDMQARGRLTSFAA